MLLLSLPAVIAHSMAGLIGLFGRGTIIQVFMATLISGAFFAAALREMPFRSSKLNYVKIFSEAQLFIILLTAMLLQTDARGLASQSFGDRDDIGTLQVAVTVASVPLVFYVVAKDAAALANDNDDKNTSKKSSGMSSMRNPMLQDGDDDDEQATD